MHTRIITPRLVVSPVLVLRFDNSVLRLKHRPQTNPFVFASYRAVAPNGLFIPPSYLLSSSPADPSWWPNGALLHVLGPQDQETLKVS